MAGRKSDFTLTKLDDLFTTQAQREEEKLSKIRDIPLGLIDDFPDHPFKVRDDEDMMQLVESVKERGVITPAMLTNHTVEAKRIVNAIENKISIDKIFIEMKTNNQIEIVIRKIIGTNIFYAGVVIPVYNAEAPLIPLKAGKSIYQFI